MKQSFNEKKNEVEERHKGINKDRWFIKNYSPYNFYSILIIGSRGSMPQRGDRYDSIRRL